MPIAIDSPGLTGAGRVRLKVVSAMGAGVAVAPALLPGWVGMIWPGSINDQVQERLVAASISKAARREKAEREMGFIGLLLQSQAPSASGFACSIYDTAI